MPFSLTVFDPEEDYDDAPASLMPLGEWLAAQRADEAPFAPDGDEGIGVLITDGSARYLEEGFGSARALAFNLREAAGRLASGQIAVLRTSYAGPSAYLLLVPDDVGVRIAQVRPQTRAPGPWDPYRPGPAGSSDSQIAEIYAWARSVADAELAATDKPAADSRRGLDLYLEADDLVRSMVRAADHAYEAAQTLGSRSWSGGDSWSPLDGTARKQATTPPVPSHTLSEISVLHVRCVSADARRMRIIQIIRTLHDLSYSEGKAVYLKAVDGHGFSLEVPTRSEAEVLAAEMNELGATVDLV